MPSFRRKALGPLAVGMALSLLGFGLAHPVQAADDLRNQIDRFTEVLFQLRENYVDAPDDTKLFDGAIDGMLKTLDPHSVYLPLRGRQSVGEDTTDEYAGIGLQFELRDNVIVVLSPLQGSPAARLGIRAGDRIIELDGKPLAKDLATDGVLKLLRGPRGSTVDVTVEREGEPDHLAFTIERAKLPVESVPYAYMIRPGVGYVRIARFAQTTSSELDKAIASLRAQGIKSLVLDLRGNPGGLLSQAVEVLDQLVPQKKRVVYTRGRIASANADYYTSDRRKLTDEPIVVLIDNGTAAASEIVAGAIQDLDRGLVAGVNSFGDGLIQSQLRLKDGSRLLLTVARFYTPSGRLIQRPYHKFADRDAYAEDVLSEGVASDSELAARPRFKTSGGRSVYGGGGIYPDVVLKEGPPLTRPQIDMLQKRVFSEFASDYMAQHKDQKWTPEALGKDFSATEADWNALRRVAEIRKAAVGDSVWRADRPFMLRQVRAEIAAATLNQTERYKILLEDDPQLNGALDLFPQASKLLGQ